MITEQEVRGLLTTRSHRPCDVQALILMPTTSFVGQINTHVLNINRNNKVNADYRSTLRCLDIINLVLRTKSEPPLIHIPSQFIPKSVISKTSLLLFLVQKRSK